MQDYYLYYRKHKSKRRRGGGIISYLLDLLTSQYNLTVVLSGGAAIIVILILLLKKATSSMDYTSILRALKRDFKIGISYVEDVKDPELKQELILEGEKDLDRETYYQVLDIVVDKQFLDYLLQKITSEDLAARKKIARTLTKIGTPQAVDYAVPLLYDESQEIKTLVIEELSKIKRPKVVSILVNYLDYCEDVLIQETLIKAFRNLGQKSVPRLLELVKSDSKRSSWIVELLGEIGGKEIVDSLLELLESSVSDDVKISAAKSLAQFPEASGVFDGLIKLADNRSCEVRAQVAKLLRKFEQEEVYCYLYQLLGDDSGIVRNNAAESLFKLGEEGIKSLILAIEEDVASNEVIKYLERVDPVKLISLVKEEYNRKILEGDSNTLEILEQKTSSTGDSKKLIG